MRGISVNWAFWLSVIVSIDQGIAHGAMNFAGVPVSWVPIIEGWAGNFAWIGGLIVTALAGLTSSSSQGVLAKMIFKAPPPVVATIIFIAVVATSLVLASGPASATAVVWEAAVYPSGVIYGARDHPTRFAAVKGGQVRKLPPKGGGVSPFQFNPLPIPLPNPTAPTTTPTTPVKNGVDPITWLRSFSVADLQTALNQGLRIDMVCTSGTAADSNMLALTGCTGTPHAGDTLAAAGGATIISVGTFTAGAGSVVLSSAQTVAGVTVTAINPSLPVDIITTPCWTFLLGIVQGTVPSILPSSLGAATAIQTAFDDEARLTSWFAPGGMFDQFGLNCAPMVNKINVQVTAAGTTIAAAVAGGPAASAAILPGIQAILGGAVAIALPK